MFGDILFGTTEKGATPAPLNNNIFMPTIAPPACQKNGIPLECNKHKQEYQDSDHPLSQLHSPCFTLPGLTLTSINDEDESIKVTLENKEQWESNDRVGIEMVVSKHGRRMLPTLKLQCKGLNPGAIYAILVDVIPVDNCRYKYHNSEWSATGKAKPHIPNRSYIHPDSPAPGSHWMKETVSFNKLKLTNNKMDKHEQIILNTMQKYKTRVHVVRANDVSSMSWGQFNTTVLDETEFIPVTAYHCRQITKLKVDNNPFVKGSRDNQRTCFGSKRHREDIGRALVEDGCPVSKHLSEIWVDLHREFGGENIFIPDLDILCKESVLPPNNSTFRTESRYDATPSPECTKPHEQSPIPRNGGISAFPGKDLRDSSPFGSTVSTTVGPNKAYYPEVLKLVKATGEYTNSINVSSERSAWNLHAFSLISDSENLPTNNLESQLSSSPENGLAFSPSFDNTCLCKQSSPAGSQLLPSNTSRTTPSTPVYDAPEKSKHASNRNTFQSYLPHGAVLTNYGIVPRPKAVKPSDMFLHRGEQNCVPQQSRMFVPRGLPSGLFLSDTTPSQASHSSFCRCKSETEKQIGPHSNMHGRNIFEHPIFSLRHDLPCKTMWCADKIQSDKIPSGHNLRFCNRTESQRTNSQPWADKILDNIFSQKTDKIPGIIFFWQKRSEC